MKQALSFLALVFVPALAACTAPVASSTEVAQSHTVKNGGVKTQDVPVGGGCNSFEQTDCDPGGGGDGDGDGNGDGNGGDDGSGDSNPNWATCTADCFNTWNSCFYAAAAAHQSYEPCTVAHQACTATCGTP